MSNGCGMLMEEGKVCGRVLVRCKHCLADEQRIKELEHRKKFREGRTTGQKVEADRLADAKRATRRRVK